VVRSNREKYREIKQLASSGVGAVAKGGNALGFSAQFPESANREFLVTKQRKQSQK
jgi:hypothetical protein